MYTRKQREAYTKEQMKDEIEAKGGFLPTHIKGGKREGAGRPRGSRNKLTKEAKKKERTIKERVIKNLDALINSQLSIAKGQNFLFEIQMKNVGGRRKPLHIQVTDPKRIKAFLDGDLEGEYFYVTAKEPDNKAIESLLDRAFGKSTTTQNNDHNFNVNILNYGEKHTQLNSVNETDNDTIRLRAEVIPDGTDPSTSEIQDSSLAQTIGEIEDSFERTDTKSTT
jgi:hypothetical protein